MSRKEVWPVMLTPFTQTGAIDYNGLEKLIAWYEENGVSGLFAVCQSSEMFYLSLRERVELARFVKRHAHVPVVASGHVSVDMDDQLEEIRRIADTGVDAVILVTNRLACDGEDGGVWMDNLGKILQATPKETRLGFYECPHPYKRLITDEELRFCAETGRFGFMKDTCCDLETIARRVKVLDGTPMRLYNANISTLLDSVLAGCAGFSGIMANFHPDLFVWLLDNYEKYPEHAQKLQAALSMCSFIESQWYPVNAKYHLQTLGLPLTTYSRTRRQSGLSETYKDEVRQMETMAQWLRDMLPRD